MEVILAIVIGVLFATGFYMMMRRSMVKLILGLSLMAHASNLLIFTVGGLVREAPPLLPKGEETLHAPYSDPLPQALILTAIVISFGVQAFAIVLVKRAYEIAGTGDFDEMTQHGHQN